MNPKDQISGPEMRSLALPDIPLQRITSVMPPPPPTAQALKTLDPESVIANMVEELAVQIVSEWREIRQTSGMAKARQQSTVQYKRNAIILENRYSKERGIEPDMLNPIDLVKSFFFHAQHLTPASWKMYRHSLLHVLNERALDFERQLIPHHSTVKALAALIVVSRHPYQEPGMTGPRAEGTTRRVKTLKAPLFIEMVTYLAVGTSDRNLINRYAHSFAIATMATGLRPGEWKTAEVRDAEQEDMPPGESPQGWMVLRVKTSKRKETEPDWFRTVLVEPGVAQAHIRQHMHFLAIAMEKDKAKLEPDRDFIRRCSLAVNQACKTLWPNHPARHCSLYTLRSQARANFAAVYGNYVSAAMLGHSPEKGQKHYAGKIRNNLSRRSNSFANIPMPQPGKGTIERAKQFEKHAEMRMLNKLAEAEANFDEEDPDEAA